MQKKAFWKSKTFWVAGLTAILSALVQQGVVDPLTLDQGTQGLILSTVFMVLRFLTGSEIGLSDIPEKLDSPRPR